MGVDLKVCSHHGGSGSKGLFTPQWEWSLDLGLSDSGAPSTALACVFPDSGAGRDEAWQIGRGMRPLVDSAGKALGH